MKYEVFRQKAGSILIANQDFFWISQNARTNIYVNTVENNIYFIIKYLLYKIKVHIWLMERTISRCELNLKRETFCNISTYYITYYIYELSMININMTSSYNCQGHSWHGFTSPFTTPSVFFVNLGNSSRDA